MHRAADSGAFGTKGANNTAESGAGTPCHKRGGPRAIAGKAFGQSEDLPGADAWAEFRRLTTRFGNGEVMGGCMVIAGQRVRKGSRMGSNRMCLRSL